MDNKLYELCDKFIQNHDILKKAFTWDNDYIKNAASIMYLASDEMPSIDKIKMCNEILKQKTGIFSEFRSNLKNIILAQMSMEENPEKYLEEIKNIFEYLKKRHSFFDNNYNLIAALVLKEHCPIEKIEYYTEKAHRILDYMKQKHPFLTNGEDFPRAVLLSLADKDEQLLVQDMEQSYEIIREKFKWNRDGLQTVSHILSLNDDVPKSKAQKVINIYETLRDMGRKYSTYSELSILGSLANIQMDVKEIATQIVETDEFLKSHKGFGNFLLGADTRLLYAANIVIINNKEKIKISDNPNSLISSTLGMILTQQLIMISFYSTLIMTSSNNN